MLNGDSIKEISFLISFENIDINLIPIFSWYFIAPDIWIFFHLDIDGAARLEGGTKVLQINYSSLSE